MGKKPLRVGDSAFLRRSLPSAAAVGLCALFSAASFAWSQGPTVNQRLQLATEAMRQGRLAEAAEGFTSVIAAEPGFAEAHFNLGLVREEQGRNEDAIRSFQKALALKPRLRGANLFLGVAEYRLNDLDKAIAALGRETA